MAQERLDWTFHYAVRQHYDISGPRNFRLKLETGVRNGDCLPACFASVLECMHRGCITSKNLEAAASKMRKYIIEWTVKNWTSYPVFNQEMQVHELVALTHDVGTSEQERTKAGPWPEDPEGRLARFVECADTLYMSDAEMLIFSCIMFERDVPICFRTWRCTGAGRSSGQFISATPDPARMRECGAPDAIIVDLAHNGTCDSRFAHYKVIDSGSLRGLTDVVSRERFPSPAPIAE
tara:strand:- start:1314 stop:2021 length:708 start_codon:yes stop_codon:yes gene_type:complete